MKKIFLIIWGDPKFYQTLIFLCQKLSRDKLKVYILCRNLDNFKDVIKKVNFGKNVKILNTPNFINYKFNLINYLIFNFFIIFHLILKNKKNVIYFNKKALFNLLFAKIIKNKINYIYHNFDFDLLTSANNFSEKVLIRLEFFCSKRCNYLIFPSSDRSEAFKKFSNNTFSKYYSFMNCFPKNFVTSNSQKFKNFLKNKKLQARYIICHLGSIGPNHHLEEIIDSFKFVNEKLILVIAGSNIKNFSKKLRKKIDKNNLDKKIYIFEDISNDYWFEILKRSKLGMCLYKQIPSSISHKYMAGTSQKFNNYLSFNIPMIVNNNLDFQKFQKNHDIYEMVDSKNPKKIAKTINKLFSDRFRYNKIKKNMKISFYEDLNFEAQFEKSYKKIL